MINLILLNYYKKVVKMKYMKDKICFSVKLANLNKKLKNQLKLLIYLNILLFQSIGLSN